MTAKQVGGFAIRAAFFAAAPSLLVFAAALFPITGALAQMALALLVFFFGEAARSVASRSVLAKKLLGSQLAFEAYYREHPPRPFLYYVFYPLLFPYWLVVKEARREFVLFKGYTLASFLLLLVSLAIQFVSAYPPELRFKNFLPIAAGTFAVETIVVLMLLMPIVTTVVHYHRERAPRRLVALLAIALLSIGVSIFRLENRRDPVVSYATRERVRMRAGAAPAKAKAAFAQALKQSIAVLPRAQGDLDSDGKVEGASLDVAHDALATFFKNDEAHAFDLWFTKKGKLGVMVVYFEARESKAPIWYAMDTNGKTIADAKLLPKGAFVAMKHAAD